MLREDDRVLRRIDLRLSVIEPPRLFGEALVPRGEVLRIARGVEGAAQDGASSIRGVGSRAGVFTAIEEACTIFGAIPDVLFVRFRN